MKFSIRAITLILISTSGCTKEQTPHTVVEGYVLELDTKIPLDSIPVKLISFSGGVNFFGGSGSTGGVDYTDENGFYRFEFEGDGSYGVDTDGDWPEYYHLASHESVNKGEYNRIDIELSPQAWFQIHVKNVNPNNYLDHVSIHIDNGSYTHYYGTTVDEMTPIYRTAGNYNWTLYWNVYREGQPVGHFDTTLYLVGHDTTYLEITY